MSTWLPANAPPKAPGYYAIRYSWSPTPDIAFHGRRGWRRSGVACHGVVAWCELPAYTQTVAA